MPIIAVVNAKGGSGKSTVAIHLAAWCAHNGKPVMLGDIDRQQSSRGWLRLRDAGLPPIASLASTQTSALRIPAGVTHVILDTPGGLHGLDLARVVMHADTIIIPVGNPIFDREAAANCIAELRSLPRVVSGRCRLAGIGMRIPHRPSVTGMLQEWAAALKIDLLGMIRESGLYAQSIEQGMTVFDLSNEEAEAELTDWAPVLDKLRPLLDAAPPSSPSSGNAWTASRPAPLRRENPAPAALRQPPC